MELTQAIARLADDQGETVTQLNGLTLYRLDQPMPRTPVVYSPSICIVAQATKRIHYGGRTVGYDSHNYLISSQTIPIEAEVVGATPQRPYLGLSLSIDRDTLSQLMLEVDGLASQREPGEIPQILSASPITQRLQDALVRLLDTLEDPLRCAVLSSGMLREIYFEILHGPHGHLLRHCIQQDAGANRITRVIQYIERHYHRPLDIDLLANHAGMSPSTLHVHFKQATTMSPMQFVKKLRLHHARRLLLGGRLASEASYRVGYNSPSQFSREFKRLFGDLPSQVQTESGGITAG